MASLKALTIIGGYLGAGKTTLLNRLLREASEPIGVLVNDFGALNIDAELIAHQDGDVIALSNGCVCCSMKDDLMAAFTQMRETAVTHVLLEASGVALPKKIAASAKGWFAFQGCYVVVDALNIERQLQDKFIKHLIRDQLEQADGLLVSKLDIAPYPEILDQFGTPVEFLIEGEKTTWLTGPIAAHEAEGRPNNPVDFNSQSWCQQTPLSKEQVRQFLAARPQIVRAKGWFTDARGECWLLQAVTGEIKMTQQVPVKDNQLVFITLSKDSIDLHNLTSYPG